MIGVVKRASLLGVHKGFVKSVPKSNRIHEGILWASLSLGLFFSVSFNAILVLLLQLFKEFLTDSFKTITSFFLTPCKLLFNFFLYSYNFF
jgi:hypothetical protein